VLGPEQIAAASQISGDRGLRLAGGPTIECGDLCSGRDIDAPEDLHEAWTISSEPKRSRRTEMRIIGIR
jgi:hypothetical protein